MSRPSTELTVAVYSAAEAKEILHEILIPLWEEIYRDVAATDPFFTTPRFLARFEGYSSAPGFSLCTAAREPQGPAVCGAGGVAGGAVIGMAFGYTLQTGARWWNGLQTEEPTGFTDEDGQRTFAINEIMVLDTQRRQGVATALHRSLLAERTEHRATLLVEPDNTPARAAYLSWGWRTVGTLKPFADSPTYESMILELPYSDGASHLRSLRDCSRAAVHDDETGSAAAYLFEVGTLKLMPWVVWSKAQVWILSRSLTACLVSVLRAVLAAMKGNGWGEPTGLVRATTA